MPINSEIKIVDDDGQTISGSEVGELIYQSAAYEGLPW